MRAPAQHPTLSEQTLLVRLNVGISVLVIFACLACVKYIKRIWIFIIADGRRRGIVSVCFDNTGSPHL